MDTSWCPPGVRADTVDDRGDGIDVASAQGQNRTAWGEGEAHGDDAVGVDEHDPELVIMTK